MNKVFPKLYSIPFSEPFARCLAQGVLTRYGGTPEILSKTLILLPSRRTCRALKSAFLEASEGKALLLPRILPLGDVDEEKVFFAGGDVALMQKPTSNLRRQVLLATLVQKFSEKQTLMTPHFDESVWLAGELLRVLDEMQREGVAWENLKNIVPSDYAEHWKLTLDFLGILKEHWPRIEQDYMIQSPVLLRNERIAALVKSWQDNPPFTPVIAAGTTGSLPVTANLLQVISHLPQGEVILQGVDTRMEDACWESLEATHPQYGFVQLLSRIGVSRSDIRLWGAFEEVRDALLSRWMIPANKTLSWHTGHELNAEQLSNIYVIEAEGSVQESSIIAVLLRETLETPGSTAALVTPDRELARRVAATLRRFSVLIDDSAGKPLAQTLAGSFIQQCVTMVQSNFEIVDVLGFLKHPLLRMGRPEKECRQWARNLEMDIIRGQFHADWQSVETKISSYDDAALQSYFLEFSTILKPFAAMQQNAKNCDFGVLWKLAIQAAEQLSQAQDGKNLWQEEGGETLWQFSYEMSEALSGIATQYYSSFAPLVIQLLQTTTHRLRFGSHPRLHILSPMEARLLHFDRVILGGLNEDSWPESTPLDPWLSRPMRTSLGLASAERRIGQSAHDFCQQFASKEVFLTRAKKNNGVQSVASRWLIRLKTMLQACGSSGQVFALEHQYLSWISKLNAADEYDTIEPPAPRPKVSTRPHALSVTQIQDLLVNPYKVYATKILMLRALDDIVQEPDARVMGNIIHAVMDEFVKLYPSELPVDIAGTLERIGVKHFEPVLKNSANAIFWHSRFQNIAQWVSNQEKSYRDTGNTAYSEIKGAWKFSTLQGEFILTAKADRLDVHANKSASFVDYKTGAAPNIKDVDLGIASQLVLEALILMYGAFGDIKALQTQSLEYWQLKGQGKSAVTDIGDIPTRMQVAHEGLLALINQFDNENTPYASIPYIQDVRIKDVIGHLARIKEWAA